MPFASKAQQKFMWANHPRIAKEWQSKTPNNGKNLPEYVKEAMFKIKISKILLEKVAQAPSFVYNPATTDSAMNAGTQIYNKVNRSPAGAGMSSVGDMINQHPAQALPRAAANLSFAKSVQRFVPPSDTANYNKGIRQTEQGQRYVNDTVPTFGRFWGSNKPAGIKASLGAGIYWGREELGGAFKNTMGMAKNLFPTQYAQHQAHVNKNIPPIPVDSAKVDTSKIAPPPADTTRK